VTPGCKEEEEEEEEKQATLITHCGNIDRIKLMRFWSSWFAFQLARTHAMTGRQARRKNV
jgi:hypothetical protein